MHFYRKTESGVVPYHFVSMTSRPEELRPTRVSDVKKLWKAGETVYPSVTTVQNVLAKPALNNWYVEQYLKQVWKSAMEEGAWETMEDWISEIKRLTELELDKAPSAGTDFHASLEAYFSGKLATTHPDYPLCEKVFEVIADKTGLKSTQDWVTERLFMGDGYGGMIDLSCPTWIVDFKTKQTADKFKPGKMVYPEHSMQLAAYRKGLVRPFAKAANCFICLEDGQIDFHEHPEKDLQKGLALFEHCLKIWQIQNE